MKTLECPLSEMIIFRVIDTTNKALKEARFKGKVYLKKHFYYSLHDYWVEVVWPEIEASKRSLSSTNNDNAQEEEDQHNHLVEKEIASSPTASNEEEEEEPPSTVDLNVEDDETINHHQYNGRRRDE